MGIARSSANFVASRETDALTNNSSLRLIKHQFLAEIQPSPKLSIGALLRFDQLKMSDPTDNTFISKTGFADQRLWMEFRLYDVVGSSLGLALLVKFPTYKIPTSQELLEQDLGSTVLLGDGQTDFSVLLTSEHWFSKNTRTRFDFGGTYRSELHAGELPFQIALGIVNPKVDFDFRIRGNLSFGNDGLGVGADAPEGIQELRTAFANSNYALASNPWGITLNPFLELWTSPKFAITFEYQYTIVGNQSPHYNLFAIGITHRWARNKFLSRPVYEKVDMSISQDPEKFQGEMIEESVAPRAIPDAPVKIDEDSDEEFR